MRPFWGESAGLFSFAWTVAIAATSRKPRPERLFRSNPCLWLTVPLTARFTGNQKRRGAENRAGFGGAADAATAKRTGAAEGARHNGIEQGFQPLEAGPVGLPRYQHEDRREGAQPGPAIRSCEGRRV